MLGFNPMGDCPRCADLRRLIEELECFIAEKAFALLQNSRFGFRRRVNLAALRKALRYKSILQARLVNPDYLSAYQWRDLHAKISQILHH